MHQALPILLLSILTMVIAWLIHIKVASIWLVAPITAVLATGLWVGSTYLLLATTTQEVGPPLPGPILLTCGISFMVALGTSAVRQWIKRGK